MNRRYFFSGRLVFLTGFACLSLTGPSSAGSFSSMIQNSWILGLKDMTSQWIGEIVHMTGALGGFFDGETANKYQLTMQRLQAGALRDYTPGENLCRLGTLSRALAASQDQSHTTAVALQTMMMDRETANRARSRPLADHDDIARRNTLASLYCNPADNDMNPAACNCDLAAGTCDDTSGPLAHRFNRDLDFARLFDSRLTLKINFTDERLTPDEQDVLAFLTTLSGYKTIPALSKDSLGNETTPSVKMLYLEMRSLVAARGIVRHALAGQIAEKTAGTQASSNFMLNALRELGMDEKEVKRYLESENMPLSRDGGDADEDVAPSYYAQMEILTKKIYQNPNFYVNLIDKPANIERTRAALMAINLMQRRDMKHLLDRRELLLAQMLEFDIRREEEFVHKRLSQGINIGN